MFDKTVILQICKTVKRWKDVTEKKGKIKEQDSGRQKIGIDAAFKFWKIIGNEEVRNWKRSTGEKCKKRN